MLEQWMKKQKLMPFLINRMNNPLGVFKKSKNKIDNVSFEMEKPVEAEEIFEEFSGDPEDQDIKSSAPHEVLEYHCVESIVYPEVSEYQDAEASSHPDMSISGYRYDGNTHKTQEYVRTMDIYVENIDKNDKNLWRTIYEEICAPYF